MIDIKRLAGIAEPKILVFGNYEGIVQSILDFDYFCGKAQPSIMGVIGVNRSKLRYFWGDRQIIIPGYLTLEELSVAQRKSVDLFVIAQSGRRAVGASEEAIQGLPNAQGGMIFAEGVPERHSLRLKTFTDQHKVFVLGPASVGITIGGTFKLGAIGGTLPDQIISGRITEPGSAAIISTSGGMINELITLMARTTGISFAIAIGGERFPLTKPAELIAQALADPNTKQIVYFGELGGDDEYEIARLLQQTKSRKPIYAYIAGTIAEHFEQAPQFGHAKALAQSELETASAKREALRKAGVLVANNFAEFERQLAALPKTVHTKQHIMAQKQLPKVEQRKPTAFVSGVSSDSGGEVTVLGQPLTDFVAKRDLSAIALAMFLGKEPKSKRLADFFDTSVKLLVDHGPQVSGAVNTMITARAGKDLSASLAAGILTIGPRFGGAVNQAAHTWFQAVNSGLKPADFVEQQAQAKQYIAGIGHKKYRLENPDPRVKLLLQKFDTGGKYAVFAKDVAAITSRKKSQLILNVDGTIAALLLDILAKDEGYKEQQLKELLDTDFCNAIFIFARSIGFIAHHLEQQRLDEGLFRLPDDQISNI